MSPDSPSAGSLSGCFTPIDWLVVIAYFVLISIIGVRLAGKQSSMEDFFRGGNKLPWYAVTASMIATIISAVTFVGVPAFAYTGNFTYLQFGIIAGLFSRLFVTLVLVPAYYRYRIFSPYDYMGKRLGNAARTVTTVLFSVLGVLGQAARVYLTALILELVLRDVLAPLHDASGLSSLLVSIAIVGVISIGWTMIGGIATVVWTDAMLFLVFLVGGITAIVLIGKEVPGGLSEVVRQGWEADKFKLFALTSKGTTSYVSSWGAMFAEPYTLWAALFAVTFGNIGSYGTDQLLAQRIFTCRNQREAQLSVMLSWTAELVVALMLFVGVGLWAFYKTFPELLTGEALAAVTDKPDKIFPVFILTQVPVALRGLIVAGIFAAAISSLTSILAALAQTTLSAIYLPWRKIDPDQPMSPEQNREVLKVSRVLIATWGIVLCAVAVAIDAYVNQEKRLGNDILLLDLALGLANYIVGTLFAAFLLAWLPLKRDAYGLIWSAPLSVFCVLASSYHGEWTSKLLIGVSAILVITWVLTACGRPRQRVLFAKTFWLVLGCGLMLAITRYLQFDQIDVTPSQLAKSVIGEPLFLAFSFSRSSIAFPWYAPLGGSIAFVFGYLLAEPRSVVME